MKEAIKNGELQLQSFNRALPKVHQPLPSNYHPELDITPFLNEDETNRHWSYISILQWIIELSHLDIYIHTALLSSYLLTQDLDI